MDYKLKNRDGAETTYTKEKLKIPAATGEDMVVFTQGEAQAEKTIDIAENGTFSVEPDAGYAFVKKVSGTVAVPTPEPVLQEKSVELTANGQTTVAPDAGKDGLSKVDITVAVPTPDLQKKTISITANGSGSVLPDEGKDGLSEVDYTVAVPVPELEEKTVEITQNGNLDIIPGSGKSGMSKVSLSVNVSTKYTGPKALDYEGVNFVSWDGTVVESWTLAQLATKTELPPLPEAPAVYSAPCVFRGAKYPSVATLISGGFPAENARRIVREFATQCMSWNSTLEALKEANMPAVVGVVLEAGKTLDYGDWGGTGSTLPIAQMPLAVVLAVPEALTISLSGMGNYAIMDDGQGNKYATAPASLNYTEAGEYVLYLWPKAKGDMGVAIPESMRPYVKAIICVAYFGNPQGWTGAASFAAGNAPWMGCAKIKSAALSPNCLVAGALGLSGCYALEAVSFPVQIFAAASDAQVDISQFFAESSNSDSAAAQAMRRLEFLCMPPTNVVGATGGWNAVAGVEALCLTKDPGNIYSATPTGGITTYPFIRLREIDLSHCTELIPYPFYLGEDSSIGESLIWYTENGGIAGVIKVPAALLEQYKAASGWSDYADYIVGV